MRSTIFAFAIAAMLCAGAAFADEPTKPGRVELQPAGNKTYIWQGQTYSIQGLSAALKTLDETQPIKRVNIVEASTPASMADVIDIKLLADELGASTFIKKNGVFKPVNLEISE